MIHEYSSYVHSHSQPVIKKILIRKILASHYAHIQYMASCTAHHHMYYVHCSNVYQLLIEAERRFTALLLRPVIISTHRKNHVFDAQAFIRRKRKGKEEEEEVRRRDEWELLSMRGLNSTPRSAFIFLVAHVIVLQCVQ